MTETEKKMMFDHKFKIDPSESGFGQMMGYAVRYALGRMSYAVNDVAHYVEKLAPVLETGALERIERDITRVAEENALGMECDKVIWLHLRQEIIHELDSRKKSD